MQTSALSFRQLLTVASSSSSPHANFLEVLAGHLSLQGPDAKAQVLSILLSKMAEIESDIDRLPINDDMKHHLRKQLSPFNSITNLTQVNITIDGNRPISTACRVG
jgi:hypothetical protein